MTTETNCPDCGAKRTQHTESKQIGRYHSHSSWACGRMEDTDGFRPCPNKKAYSSHETTTEEKNS